MTRCTYLIGDVFDRLAELPDGSVDLVLTSPPFLALRSYLPPDHPDKAKEIGSEPTPADFIDTLLALTAEWRRVLAPHGSICVELGDTYAGFNPSPGSNAYGAKPSSMTAKIGKSQQWNGGEGAPTRGTKGPGWPLAKSLCLIPELYRVALVYGFNPLRGPDHRSPAGQWRARNVVRWVRPNPPVGALGDKFRPATSDMVIACVSDCRWFDLTAVRTPVQHPDAIATRKGKSATDSPQVSGRGLQDYDSSLSAGAPPLDWWKISPGGYSGSHYAVFPPELLTIPVESMCPREVCRSCGAPRRRVEGEAEYAPSASFRGGSSFAESERVAEGVNQWVGPNGARASVVRSAPTLGWTDCGHDDYRPGVVLDPFMGSGTTGLVATGHGRDAIGIDLDERNADLARERIGLFLDVYPRGAKAA